MVRGGSESPASSSDAGQKVPREFALYAISSLVRDLVFAIVRAGFASVLIFVPEGFRKVARAVGMGGWIRSESAEPGCAFYEGKVVHVRTFPTEHRFRYAVRYAIVDLDSPPRWFTRLQPDCLTAQAAREMAGTTGPVRWLAFPRSMGYEQNPISVYYCYAKGADPAAGAEPEMCVAAVTNTPWGERVHFAFQPGKDHIPKPLHVSPFMEMNTYWKIYASPPGDSLSLTITSEDKEHGTFFTAMLRAEKAAPGNSSPDAWFWLMPHLVAVWIYWEAVLLMSKGVSFVSHPKYGSGEKYRRDALSKEEQLGRPRRGAGGCPVFQYRDATVAPWTL